MKTNYKILVVDDDEGTRKVLREILSEIGYTVDVAKDGIEAITKAKCENFDAALVDIQMPKMNGIDLLKAIKNDNPTVPVVMLTGFPSLDIAIEAMKKGASDFITKPFKIDQLEIIVNKMIRERNLLVENEKLNTEIEQKKMIEQLNDKLNKKIKELSILYSISDSMNSVRDRREIFDKILEMAAEITSSQKVSLMFLDREKGLLAIVAAKGIKEDLISDVQLYLGEGIAGKVALSGKYMLVEDIHNSPYTLHEIGGNCRGNSLIAIPLMIREEIFGVLSVTEKKDGSRYTEEEVSLLLTLAEKAALSMENYALYENIYDNLIATLQSLVTSLEAKDTYTMNHSLRVTELSINIAREMNCSSREIESLKFSASLHDIGKIGIKDSVLVKPGKLSKEEFDHIKDHTVIGENIVKPLGLSTEERAVIRNHHERWDGKGYPDGLQKEETPLLARILSVADSFDAMSSDRPYRKAKNLKESLEELVKCSGSQFDAKIVEAFMQSILRKTEDYQIKKIYDSPSEVLHV